MKIPIGKQLFYYRGKVRDVHDGDTFRADVDLGLGTIRKYTDLSFRLAIVDTPEKYGAEYEDGIFVRDLVRDIILGKDVIINTEKAPGHGGRDEKGSFGRWLAWVFVPGSNVLQPNESLNEYLLRNGYASFWGEPWTGLPGN